MVERLRNQRGRFHNLSPTAFRRMHRGRVLDRVERALSLRGAAKLIIGFRQRNCANPGHEFLPLRAEAGNQPSKRRLDTLHAASHVANSWNALLLGFSKSSAVS